jgi:hypothetical protein
MERNLGYLNKHRIVYRQLPTTDVPTDTFDWGWFYEEGTFQCYTLFTSKAKITTFKSLKWHLLVLWYLNPQLDPDDFIGLSKIISNRDHGFATFTLKDSILDKMVYEISMMELDEPPKNRARKVIFKPFINMPINEKLSIVGKLIGRGKSTNEGDIYQCMLDVHEMDQKITYAKLAKILGCSSRTVQRNIGDELKREKELLNREL